MESSEKEDYNPIVNDKSNFSDETELSDCRNGNLDKADEFLPKSTDAMAKGLSSMLTDIVRDFDSRAENTLKSQDQLSFSLDRLGKELDQLLEDAPLPFIMAHAARISGVRKRVSSLNSLLKSIQRRVDNIDRMLSVDMRQEKEAVESSGQQ